MRRIVGIWLLLMLLVTGLSLPGCCCGKKEPVKPAPVIVKKPAPVKKAAPATECGLYEVSRTQPCSECAVVKIDKKMPKEVQLNSPFDYTITVTNLTDMMLADVVVTEKLARNFKPSGASPTAKTEAGQLVWVFDSLEPKASKEITVTGQATDTNCLTNCASLTYVIPACASTKVVQSKLQLVKKLPSEVLICDPIPAKFVVSNSGTGAAKNVVITDALPEGLTTSEGKSSMRFNAGTLGPGQSKEFSASLKASKTGKYTNKAVATSAGGAKAQATSTTVVRQPVLAITKTGPKRQYLGRSISYDITVTNKGDAPAANAVIEDTIPAGVTSTKVSSGGTVVGSKAVWRVGTIPVNGSKKVSISYTPSRAGTFSNKATASARCTDTVSASARTGVVGIPAVLLEVIDLIDPVEVGGQTTYVITATNQGSMAGTDIRIVCTLEENQQFVSASGATRGSAEGGTVTFAPLPSLAPKAKAVWRVVVKAVKAGDVRFTVAMNTAQLGRSVDETEATNFYE